MLSQRMQIIKNYYEKINLKTRTGGNCDALQLEAARRCASRSVLLFC